MHIPTILAGVFEGPVIGGIVGAMFGAFSMYQAQLIGSPLEKIIFSNPAIALLPRILIGVVSYYVFTLVKGKVSRAVLALAMGALLGYTGYSLAAGAGVVYQRVVGVALAVIAATGVLVVDKKYGMGGGPALAAVAGSLTNTVLVLSLTVAFGHMPAAVRSASGSDACPKRLWRVRLTTLCIGDETFHSWTRVKSMILAIDAGNTQVAIGFLSQADSPQSLRVSTNVIGPR
jgi:uncharacterized membrane protein